MDRNDCSMEEDSETDSGQVWLSQSWPLEVRKSQSWTWGSAGAGGELLSSQQRFHGSISCMCSCEHVITIYPAERAKMRPDVPIGPTETRMVFSSLSDPQSRAELRGTCTF